MILGLHAFNFSSSLTTIHFLPSFSPSLFYFKLYVAWNMVDIFFLLILKRAKNNAKNFFLIKCKYVKLIFLILNSSHNLISFVLLRILSYFQVRTNYEIVSQKFNKTKQTNIMVKHNVGIWKINSSFYLIISKG